MGKSRNTDSRGKYKDFRRDNKKQKHKPHKHGDQDADMNDLFKKDYSYETE